MSTRSAILRATASMRVFSSRDVVRRTGLSSNQVYCALDRCWRAGYVLRTAEAVNEVERVNKGRGGVSVHNRPYHLYCLRPEESDELALEGRRFVAFSDEFLDPRRGVGNGASKAQRVIGFLRENSGRAFFSVDVAEALKPYGVMVRDVMSCVRRHERRGRIYVRGYKSEERETPFVKGYLLTWLDQEKPRVEAIAEAVHRTDVALDGSVSSSPAMERIHRVRDMVIEHTLMRKLVGTSYMEKRLGCGKKQLDQALERTLQLYPDIKVAKLFDAYRYFYHSDLGPEDLDAAVEMKKNYIRIAKGAANRIGHNWEAVADWFIDRTTPGASFWTQNHREGGMDSRRITLHLIKSVGGRRRSAEVDRVWDVTPGIFAPSITYVLSCKWGLVTKAHVDDFLEVMRWSKGFGVETPEGRQVRQGVVGVFAAGAFKSGENVQLKDGTKISLAQYAARRNLQLITAADFNKMLRERGCPKEATVQKVCRAARGEAQVREALDAFWGKPGEATEVLGRLRRDNQDLYRFEEMLEAKEEPRVYE